MKDLGFMPKFLGVEIEQVNNSILLHQINYARTIIDKSYHANTTSSVPLSDRTCLSKEIGTSACDKHSYQVLVGKLHYLIKTQLEISFF